jgi:hypothetical protein
MKKRYVTPVMRVMAIDEQSSILVGSTESKATGFLESGDGNYEQSNVTGGTSVTSPQVLAKPWSWDDGEAE